MTSTFIWILAAWAAALFLLYKLTLGRGRSYGNKVAKHLGWSNNFFHSVLDNGMSSSLTLLRGLAAAQMSPAQAAVELSPSLARGLTALEIRFCPQAMIEDAKPVVARLLQLR